MYQTYTPSLIHSKRVKCVSPSLTRHTRVLYQWAKLIGLTRVKCVHTHQTTRLPLQCIVVQSAITCTAIIQGPKIGQNELDCACVSEVFTFIPLVYSPYIKPVGQNSFGLLQAGPFFLFFFRFTRVVEGAVLLFKWQLQRKTSVTYTDISDNLFKIKHSRCTYVDLKS